MKIAILFGDNDFYNCFYGVLEAIKNASFWSNDCVKKIENKEYLCLVINQISYGIYLLYQEHQSKEEKSGQLDEHIKDWLQITPEMILFGNEVEKYIKGNPWDNAETFVLYTDEFNPTVPEKNYIFTV